jgi:hypothetical protein
VTLFAAGQGGPRNIAVAIFGVLTLGWVIYLLLNLRKARAEVGSEIELAPNRKPYYDDEALEGPRLERAQIFALGMLQVARQARRPVT